jgi:SAM-dependent methyltransferase
MLDLHELDRILRRLPTASTPYDVFQGVSDDIWLRAHLGDEAVPGELRRWVPASLPSDVQRTLTGTDGVTSLREGFKIYRMIADACARSGAPIEPSTRVLDFGCGWGRILRFFMRDVLPDRLVGVDCLPLSVDACTQSNPWCEFQLISAMPPTTLTTGSFDVVFLYSVFSHLSEAAHRRWIPEFFRMLRPGGLLIASTRPRWYIEWVAQARAIAPRPAWVDQGPALAFLDTAGVLERYDRGEYCHTPIGSAPPLDASIWGETCIPRTYAEQQWEAWFDILDFIDDPATAEQAVIVARRRERAVEHHSVPAIQSTGTLSDDQAAMRPAPMTREWSLNLADWPQPTPQFAHLAPAWGFVQGVTQDGNELSVRGWMLIADGPFDKYELYVDGTLAGKTAPKVVGATGQAIPQFPHAGISNYDFRVEPSRVGPLCRFDVIGFRSGRATARLECIYRANADQVVPLPSPEQMIRVTNLADAAAFRLWGTQVFGSFVDAILRHKSWGTVRRLLDWGCGVGRVTAHFLTVEGLETFGADIDPGAIAWCTEQFKHGQFSTLDPLPPTPYDNAQFDVVVGYSVFTHLPREVQHQWLDEMERIIAPGGLLIATVHGAPTARFFSAEFAEQLRTIEIIDEARDHALDGIAPRDYYRSTFQSREYTIREFGKHFEILEYVPLGASHIQDLVVMRHR